VRGHTLGSPLLTIRGMTPEAREAHLAEYRKGFKINPIN
jgi:propane monooxygenase large subunit